MPPATPTGAIAADCRHYRGDKPCTHNRLCAGCSHYQPYQHRICIIKLGALGDVIRTLCILPELRRHYAEAHITWVSLPSGRRMIQGHPMIDRVVEFGPMTGMVLMQETFDLLISLDKEPEPCALAMSLFAKEKLGIGLSPQGKPIPLNPEAHAYFHLGLSDELKFKANQKSYPVLVHEALGLHDHGQGYTLPVNETRRDRVRLMLASAGWEPGRETIGINVGAGTAFANKMWPAARQAEVVRLLRGEQPEAQILLLGGPPERPIIDRLLAECSREGGLERIIDAGTEHDEPGFVALVDTCDVLFTGDTMAMHVAIALGKGVVAYFGPTCEQEIDLYGRGEKLVATVPCGPCYKRVCDRGDACVNAHSPQQAAAAVARVLEQQRDGVTHQLPVIPRRLAG